MSTFALVHGPWHGERCWEKLMVNPRWSRRVARDWLDAELIRLPGSHSPFLSRPKTLAELLNRLVAD